MPLAAVSFDKWIRDFIRNRLGLGFRHYSLSSMVLGDAIQILAMAIKSNEAFNAVWRLQGCIYIKCFLTSRW